MPLSLRRSLDADGHRPVGNSAEGEAIRLGARADELDLQEALFDGGIYVSVQKTDQSFELVEINPSDGSIIQRKTIGDGGFVFNSAGSVWVGQSDPTGFNRCSILRFEPGSLAVQATIPVGCDFLGPLFAATDGAVWWLDRSTADIDGHGGRLRSIDPATNENRPGVELPTINGNLWSSRTTVFYGGDLGDPNTYRLDAGGSTFVSMGEVPSPAYAGGNGLWTQLFVDHIGQSEADFYSATGGPQARLVIEGVPLAADETAVYTSRAGADGDELWRYPTDGSLPSTISVSTSLQTTSNTVTLYYGGNGGSVILGENWAVGTWLVPGLTTAGSSSVIIQSVALP